MQDMIQTKSLEFRYGSGEEDAAEGTAALRGVDLSIRRGEFVVILGHNGSGKSTLAKHFNAILLPSGGQVFVDGMDTADEA
ncbi:MAG: ATP-binding cassette domain-containing protein, partial [Oscillospiraceae bacterium]|nr:ATP-binding cassette domain-containing protein [Oscillospiraceae bacterium]